MPEGDAGGGEDGAGRPRVGEVGLEVAREALPAPRCAGAPRLCVVVGLPALGEDRRAVRDEPAGDREADALGAADAGDQRAAAAVGQSPSSGP